MAKRNIKDYTLYRWRFWIGYSLIAVLTTATLLAALFTAPSGISAAEEQSTLKAASLSADNPDSLLIIDAPFYILQRISIAIFGVTSWSIALPSLLAGLLAITCLLYILRWRFRHSVGIITTGIVAISPFFISIATEGTPRIMLAFWPILLLTLALATLQAKHARSRTIMMGLLFFVVGCSLFTPFSLGTIVLLGLVAFAHPRSRYALRKTPKAIFGIGGAWIAAVGVCIGYMLYRSPSLITDLIYKTDSFSLDLLHNLSVIGSQFIATPSDSLEVLTPIFSLGTIALALVGAYYLARWRHALLSYLVAIWTVAVTVLLILNPYATVLLFAPFSLLVAAGVDNVLRYWYRLFPFNPYARTFGIIPVTILFTSILISGISGYFNAYHYTPSLASHTNNDLELILEQLETTSEASLVTNADSVPFYRFALDSHDYTDTVVSTVATSTDTVIATRDATHIPSESVSRVVAADRGGDESDRLYIYQTAEK